MVFSWLSLVHFPHFVDNGCNIVQFRFSKTWYSLLQSSIYSVFNK